MASSQSRSRSKWFFNQRMNFTVRRDSLPHTLRDPALAQALRQDG